MKSKWNTGWLHFLLTALSANQDEPWCLYRHDWDGVGPLHGGNRGHLHCYYPGRKGQSTVIPGAHRRWWDVRLFQGYPVLIWDVNMGHIALWSVTLTDGVPLVIFDDSSLQGSLGWGWLSEKGVHQSQGRYDGNSTICEKIRCSNSYIIFVIYAYF